MKLLLALITIAVSFAAFSQPEKPKEDQLYDAIKANNLAQVKILIGSGVDINAYSFEDHTTPISAAIKYNSLPIVKYLIEKGATERRSIYHAVSNNNIPMVEYLLSHGFTPGQTTVDAAEKNNMKMLKILVEAGASVNYSEKRRRGLFRKYYVTPIGFAVGHKNDEMVLYFIEHGVPIDKAVNEAFSHSNYDLVKKLSKQISDKGPLLLRAFNYENNDLIDYLIREGANVNSENEQGNSMLLIAAKNGNLNQIIDCLEKYMLYLHKKNNRGETALMLAAQGGHLPICEILFKHGIKLEAQNNLGETALFYSLDNKYKSTFDFLVQAGANINHLNLNGDNLLIAATRAEQLATMQILFGGGMDIHHANKEGRDAYYYSLSGSPAFSNKTMLQDFFINEGVDVNTQGSSGRTAMFLAIANENMERVLYLKGKGASVNVNDISGIRPDCDDKNMITYLVNNGADINAFDDRHNTFLCDAIEDNDLELAHFLMDNGADPNLKCYFKEQPIIKAIEDNNLILVKFLTENGADVNAIGYFNKSVMEYALENKVDEIIAYLKSKGSMTKDEKNEMYRVAMEVESKIKAALISEDLTTVNRILAQNNVVIMQRKLVQNLAFVAAKHGNSQLINKLLSDDVAFNIEDAVNDLDQTILFIATMYNQEIIVKDLLAKGADFKSKDTLGKTAAGYADKKSIKKIYKNWSN